MIVTPKPPTFKELITAKDKPFDFKEFVAKGGSIRLPPRELSFKEKAQKFGVVTATTELIGDVFAETTEKKQITNKAISDIIKNIDISAIPLLIAPKRAFFFEMLFYTLKGSKCPRVK